MGRPCFEASGRTELSGLEVGWPGAQALRKVGSPRIHSFGECDEALWWAKFWRLGGQRAGSRTGVGVYSKPVVEASCRQPFWLIADGMETEVYIPKNGNEDGCQ